MGKLLDPVLARWPLVALIASAAMLATAHAFERLGYAPCVLCLRQREVYWTAGATALAAFVLLMLLRRPRWGAAANLVLGLIFLVGVGVAAFHAGVEWKWWPGPEACASGGAASVTAADMDDFLAGKPVQLPACDEAAWVFLGLSMAGWNALASLALAVLSFVAARRAWRRA